MNKTYKIMTFGCQMNENDSEKLSGMLKAMGYTPIEDERKAGVVIILNIIKKIIREWYWLFVDV